MSTDATGHQLTYAQLERDMERAHQRRLLLYEVEHWLGFHSFLVARGCEQCAEQTLRKAA